MVDEGSAWADVANGHPPMTPDVRAEIAQLEAAYAIIAARDGRAERRAWHWQIMAVLALLGGLVQGVWDHLDQRGILKPFVQTVVQQEDGTLVSFGVPVELLQYTPADGEWLEMVGEWIQRYRRQGKDPVLAYGDRTWLQYHTCGGDARRLLTEQQGEFQPERVGNTLVTVELRSVTKTVSPLSYQVLWQETTIQSPSPPSTKQWTGTLTTGRIHPSSEEMLLQNRRGLCVSAFDVSPHPSGGGV